MVHAVNLPVAVFSCIENIDSAFAKVMQRFRAFGIGAIVYHRVSPDKAQRIVLMKRFVSGGGLSSPSDRRIHIRLYELLYVHTMLNGYTQVSSLTSLFSTFASIQVRFSAFFQ